MRIALLDLLAETGTVTATEAAARLGHSSGLCSFHLRQLARHGLVEEAPHRGGRARPWRLRWDGPRQPEGAAREFTALARDLEDESHKRWLEQRPRLPVEWQGDHSFSAVVHLTPAEVAEVAAGVRELLAAYQGRDRDPAGRPADAVAVAAVTRLFPLL
ncbi:winged helix-turn-helix domain-containing protein [Streptomyces sulfonofaciens]|uniref:winged helix-turn-helix domain-containing protein n=1 Tax=Streptomyces sulfonofaciens TaxID=68272 RepID=UPI001E42B87C|nr:winged helix-turn-helix domain-containing protein [Streptomyces sulfonofaciens]